MIGALQSKIDGISTEIRMTDYIVEGQQNDTLCSFTIKQKFVNETGKTAECSYIFPNDCKFCIYDTEFVINGKVIRPEIREKGEAKKEFDEAVKQGHSAMICNDLGNGTYRYNLGNIKDREEVEIRVKASFLCTVTEKDITLKFPLAAKFQRGLATSSLSDKVNFDFNMNIHQNSSDIKSVNCSVKNDVTKVDSKTHKLSIKTLPKDDAIFISTVLAESRKSIALSADGYICISAFPSFEAKRVSNSEYVFIVDCSGSMSGSRIENAVKCMKIFIRSLPEECKFAIWRFGSRSECMFPSCDYTKENVEKATSLLSGLRADLGGTNLFSPLKEIISKDIPKGYTRQLFVLTDGEIYNTKEVLGLVRSERGKNRIFSIGLGSGADSGLITGLAEISNGMGVQVDNETLTEKVIEMLESAIQPAMSDVSIISEGMTEQWPSPSPAIYNHSQQNFIIKSPHQEYVLISGSVTGESVDETISVYKAPDGVGLKELFMSKAIEDLQYEIRDEPNESKKKKIIDYSIASRVLSEYTSYVGIDIDSCYDGLFECERSVMRSRPPMAKCSESILGCLAPPDCCLAPPDCCLAPPDCCFSEPFIGCNAPMRLFENSLEEQEKKKARMKGCCEEPMKERFTLDKETRSSDNIEDIILSQNPNGSWDSSEFINEKLVQKFNKHVAATIASIAYIRVNAGSQIKSFKLIIKKALSFLSKFDTSVDWEAIIKEESEKL